MPTHNLMDDWPLTSVSRNTGRSAWLNFKSLVYFSTSAKLTEKMNIRTV
jgi:hypothetical protein